MRRFGGFWICRPVGVRPILAFDIHRDTLTMLKLEPPVVLPLQAGQMLHWQQAEAVSLRVLRGRVWVTQADDLDDHFLDAGASMRLAPNARVLIGAEAATQIAIEREPQRAGASRRRRRLAALARAW